MLRGKSFSFLPSLPVINLPQKDEAQYKEDYQGKNSIPLLSRYDGHDADKHRTDNSSELAKHIEEAIELGGMTFRDKA